MRSNVELVKLLVVFSITIFVGSAYALGVEEDFSSLDRLESGGLVWNIGLATLHPPIENYDYMGGGEQYSAGIGSSRDGSFELATYSQFGSISGMTITVDTDAFVEGIQVSNFILESGWTLTAVGSKPLIIRSQSDITVNGTISCSGLDGDASSANAAGGVARCGGAAGGQGGSSPSKGVNGGGGAVTGGDPAGVIGSGDGGGGGGGYNTAVLATNGGGGSGGGRGLSALDNAFTQISGSGLGSGSGGGGGRESGADGGGAGGAGGGLLLLFAGRDISVGVGGNILANGGVGGVGVGTSGGGGGGGGGSILAFAFRDFLGIPFGAGVVNAVGGSAGAPNGGVGSYGRTWFVDRLGILNSGELPTSSLAFGGSINTIEGTFTSTSKEVNLGVSQGTLSSVDVVTQSALCVGCSVTVEVASSSESGFDPTGMWEVASSVDVDRYLKFRITVVNADRNDGPFISKLTFNYEGILIEDFSFVTGCGSVANTGRWSSLVFCLFLLPLGIALALKARPICHFKLSGQ